MVDTTLLRQAVSHFKNQARPSNSNGSSPATIRDINNLISQTATVLNKFIEELEKEA